MKTYLFVYSVTVLLVIVLTPLVIWLGWRFKLTDTPGPRKVHSDPVPRIGGVVIYAAAMCVIIPVLFLPNKIGDEFRTVQPKLSVLLCAATGIFVVGLIDDIRQLRARTKLLTQLAAAMLVCSVGIRIKSVVVPELFMVDFGWFSWPLTILWIVGIANAVNLSDGLDGLAVGISAITCGVIAMLAIGGGQVVMAVLMLALLGSLSGFLCYNFCPAKIFLGDCGSLFLGFVIASSSILCFMKSSTIVGLSLPLVALGLPIFDTLFSMLRRFLARRSIFAADHYHFHHRLLRLGFSQRHAVLAVYIVTIIATGLGTFMIVTDGDATLVVLACILVLLLVLFRVVGSVRLRETITGFQKRVVTICQIRTEMHHFENLQLQFEYGRSFPIWWQNVCRAADQFEFAWMSMTTTDREGNSQTFVWRRPDFKPDNNIIIIYFPIHNSRSDLSAGFEVATPRDGSLEAATRRVSFFGRLIDENRMPAICPINNGQLSVERITMKVHPHRLIPVTKS